MNDVDELIAFLRAQLDVDERAADMIDSLGLDLAEPPALTQGMALMSPEQYVNASGVLSGDRFRADIEAKRRILDWLADCYAKTLDGNWWTLEVVDALKAMAQPYAGRPGFRPEWAVTE